MVSCWDWVCETHKNAYEVSRCDAPDHSQARFEAFNFFNTPWFGAPNTNVMSTAFGTVAPNQANDPRNIQFGVRLTF